MSLAQNINRPLIYELFHDLFNYQIAQSNTVDIQSYSLFTKIITHYMNSGLIRDCIANRYALKAHDNTGLAIWDNREQEAVNIVGYAYYGWDKAIDEKFREFEKLFGEKTGYSYRSPYSYLDSFKDDSVSILPLGLTHDEEQYSSDFFASQWGEKYPQPLDNKTSIESLLKRKMGLTQASNVIFFKDFVSFYRHLEENFQHGFNSHYEGSKYSFRKNIYFMANDLGLDYIHETGENKYYSKNSTDHWAYIEQQGKYAGGSYLANSYFTEIRAVSLMEKHKTEKVYGEVFDNLMKSPYMLKDIVAYDLAIDKFNLLDSLRFGNQDKRIYYGGIEKALYARMDAFISINGLDHYREDILEDFYNSIIQGADRSLYPSELSEQYLKETLNEIQRQTLDCYDTEIAQQVTNRESFVGRCVYHTTDIDTYNQFKDNSYQGIKFCFIAETYSYLSDIDSSDYGDILDKIKESLSYMGFDLNSRQLERLSEKIEATSFIATNDDQSHDIGYSFHALYDFLVDESIISNISTQKVYRIESEGLGPYRGEKADLKVFKEHQERYDYSQRKLPGQDRGLSTLFCDHDYYEIDMKQVYSNQYIFGFSSHQQLLDWFEKGEILSLDKLGMKIYEHSVPTHYVIDSGCQVVFKKDKILESKVLTMDSLFEEEKNKIKTTIKLR